MKNLALVFTVIGLLALSGLTGCRPTESATAESPETIQVIGTVQLEVDFGGRAEKKTMRLDCREDSTVFSILQGAEQEGWIQVSSRGSGENSFLIGLDDIENEGATGDNWIYRLNGQVGKVGAGAQSVVPNDEINWTFGEYEVPEREDPNN